jgi:hypothetical protein
MALQSLAKVWAARLRMPAFGTTRTCQHVRTMSAIAGEPDIERVNPTLLGEDLFLGTFIFIVARASGQKLLP